MSNGVEAFPVTGRPLHANDHCRHYDYVRGEGPKCACGVDLPGSVLHCLPNPPTACGWREEYTDAERATWKAWVDDRSLRMFLILAQIPGSSRDKKNKPEWGKSGSFPCPACVNGTVSWFRVKYNGHVRAACTTQFCCEFME